ncbi:MAG: LITAF-like zinc ribbon domain-containing protein [Blastocatellia bacterium]|nr:LITAF-like zinc ribbon domain-containing protein [Blastocatellia bacterium]
MANRQTESYEQRAPRPYAWKTDEYQTQAEPRPARPNAQAERIGSGGQFPNAALGAQALAYRGPQDMAGNYRCPYCGTNFLPVIERRVSSAGWITFSLLLIFTIVFFWIGLLMKEDVAVCPMCRNQIR